MKDLDESNNKLFEKLKELEVDEELLNSVKSFIKNTETVFDLDWEYTKGNINHAYHYFLMKVDGTFLNPNVHDEENNWSNRGAYLSSYRRLVAALKLRDEKLCQKINTLIT